MITGKTKVLALIGSPISHSGSPAMYNYSFERLGIDYTYVAWDIKEKDVQQALDAMRLFQMPGGNVTMPDKIAAARYVEELSDAARMVGAVNTIVNQDGRLIGHITDGIGFNENLKDHGVEITGKKVVIAGGGGAATAIQVQMALDGVKELSIFNRNDEFYPRSLQTAETIRKEVPDCVVHVYDLDNKTQLAKEVEEADILVNATIVGMKPLQDCSILDGLEECLHEDLVVADTVYNPLETRLLQQASEKGCLTVNGKGMLLWQGVAAFELFTGQKMPVQEVKEKFFSE